MFGMKEKKGITGKVVCTVGYIVQMTSLGINHHSCIRQTTGHQKTPSAQQVMFYLRLSASVSVSGITQKPLGNYCEIFGRGGSWN